MSATHRRFSRLQTRQEAKVTLPDGTVLDCEITDFCQKGLNLTPLDGPDSEFPASVADLLESNLSVTFASDDPAKPGDFSFIGKLVRGTPQSLGLYTESLQPDAYKALTHARSSLLAADSPPSGLLPSESEAILQDCVNTFRLFLAEAWRRFLDKIMVRIREFDASPLPLPEHSRFLSALHDLNRRSEAISRHHFSLILERLHDLERPTKTIKEAGPDTELTIIDEVKFEDWLNIAAVFNRQEAEIRTPMYEFAQRISRLMPGSIDKSNDPFGPETVCLTFQESLLDVDLSNAMRAILYTLFGQSIAPGYPDLYERFVQLLAPLRPNVSRSIIRETSALAKPASSASGASDDMANQISRLAEVAEKLFSLYPPAAMANATAAATDVANDVANEIAPASAATRATVNPSLAQPGKSAQPAGERGHLTAPGPQQMWALLQHALHLGEQGVQATPGGSTLSSDSPAEIPAPRKSGRQIVNIDDLLARLGGKRTNQGNGLGGRSVHLSETLAALLSKEAAAGHVPRPQFERIDLLTNIINQAAAELPSASQIDALLAKLERPLYQSALRGDELLNQPDHPLRRLFNLIDRFAIVADDSGQFLDQELFALVDSIIDRVAAKTETDVGVLTHACENLEKLLKHPIQQRKQRVIAYQELCESQRRQQDARRQVAEWLDQRLSGRDVPKLVTRLLEIGWRHHLLLLQLRGGSEAVEDALTLLDDLVGALRGESGSSPRELIAGIEQGLATTSIDTLQTEAFLEELTTRLAANQIASSGKGTRSRSEDTHIPSGAFTANLPKPSAQDGSDQEAPRVGDWWTIKTNNKPVPMQLIWSSPSTAALAFVNRSATRKSDLGLSEFSRMIRQGDALPTENKDIPLLDRSEHGVVDSVFRNLARESGRDAVTGMLNRKGWLQAIRVCQEPADESQTEHTLCLLEFHPIQMIYDSCGVEAAESLARELATALRAAVGEAHPIAAIRDGVFAVFLARLSVETGRRIANGLLRKLGSYHFKHGSQSFAINLAIGLAGCKPGLTDAESVMRRASAACTTAQGQGGDCLQVYEDKGDQLRERESLMEWAGKIDAMLTDGSLYLRCQRIAPISPDSPLQAYYEILLGIRQSSGPEVSPQAFIQAVEMMKRSRDIDLWVANSVFRWIRAHPEAFAEIGGFSVNLSATSLADSTVLAALEQELGAGDLPTEKIMFEITETATLAGYGSARDFMRRIRRYGCKFCIDDFGSGNASYGYLKNLRTDTLKIDGAYVKDILKDPSDLALVKSMNDIGHSLGMKTVAEYAATPEILEVLKGIGVDYVQGYAVHVPTPLDALLDR